MKLKPFRRLSSIFSFSPQRCFPFSTSLTPNHPRSSHSFDDVVPRSSAVYSHALKFQRPMTINWRPQLENTASFIGTVTREPKRVNLKSNKFSVHTVLKVSRSKEPNSSSCRVLLMMSDCVAEFASKHLKPNDFIYVSGCLGSYTKPDASGNLQLNYKLHVKELNFVAQRLGHQEHKKLDSIEAEVGIQKDQNRLHLWQVFFTNPHEWWDQRKRKLNPKQPDFKHKDTGEVLWLSEYDPPWVKRQLQLLDSKIAGGGPFVRRSRVSNWVYDE
ncbi:protein OSB1, mitochondrial-like [Gastrolobium bilobum]|uniref:protein OSB1, mitochondrial-like n=1 Tax=Gastrolobium bilobum TaxID=150636 RepID=UPI002AB24C0D|nr:protein OSB1, mitochondrial-like [Gastrolobium bilobum]